MPKNWKSVIGQTDTIPKPPALEIPKPDFDTKPEGLSGLEDIAAQNPESGLSELISQRKELESRMKELIGEKRKNYENNRFKVLSHADRIKEKKDWENKQDQIKNFHNQAQLRQSQFSQRRVGTEQSRSGLNSRPIDNGLTRGIGSFNPSSAIHRLNDKTRFKNVQDKLLKRPKAIDDLHTGIGEIRGQVNKLSTDFQDVDKKLNSPEISQADRDEIKGLLKSKEVNELTSKLGGYLDKADNILGTPKKAADKIEGGWQNRRRQIDGTMQRFGNYAKSRDRRLSTEFGGSGDIFARLAETRAAALKKQREKRRQEQLDQKRRERALKRKRKKDSENL